MAWSASTDFSPLIQKAVHQARSQPLGNPILTYRKAASSSTNLAQLPLPHDEDGHARSVQTRRRISGQRQSRPSQSGGSGIKDEADSEDDLLILQHDSSSPRRVHQPSYPQAPSRSVVRSTTMSHEVDNELHRMLPTPSTSSEVQQQEDEADDDNDELRQQPDETASTASRTRRQQGQKLKLNNKRAPKPALPVPIVEVEVDRLPTRPNQAHPAQPDPTRKTSGRKRQMIEQTTRPDDIQATANEAVQQRRPDIQEHTPNRRPKVAKLGYRWNVSPAPPIKVEEEEGEGGSQVAEHSTLSSRPSPFMQQTAVDDPANGQYEPLQPQHHPIEEFLCRECQPAVPPALLGRYVGLFEDLGVHSTDELIILAHSGEALDLWMANARSAGLSVLWESIVRVALGRLKARSGA